MSGKRNALVLVLALCTALFACLLYFRSRRVRVDDDHLRPSHLPGAAIAAVSTEESYEVAISPRRGYILVDDYDGQQGAGLESLISLQVCVASL